MKKHFLKIFTLSTLLLTVLFTSCKSDLFNNEESFDLERVLNKTDNPDDYASTSIFIIEESGKFGKFGCFELVFPITIVFADQTTEAVESYEEMFDAFKTWKENNQDVKGKPSLEFPIDVLNENAELQTINNVEELVSLKKECKETYFEGWGGDKRPKHGNCEDPKGHNFEPCFELIFPITIKFPDGSSDDASDFSEIKVLLKEWKIANPDSSEKPSLEFPISVEFEDGTTQEVNDFEELKMLKKDC